MNAQHTWKCIFLFCILSLQTSEATSNCSLFKFVSPEIRNGSLVLRENTIVNITFRLSPDCDILSLGTIDISKWIPKENMFARQCTIFTPCKEQPVPSNISCHCLEPSRSYGVTFVALRYHSTRWRWSTSNPILGDFCIDINVTYPPQVMQLKLEASVFPIPRFGNATVLCEWQNGNPPTLISLLSGQNNLLASGNNFGNISYTFHSVDCNDTGLIRCEAGGSHRNMSTSLLVQCPPEIDIPLPKLMIVFVGHDSDVTFPFRSHTSNITCDMIQMNKTINNDLVHFHNTFNLTDLIIHESNRTVRKESWLYAVTGFPPNLHATIKVRDLNMRDVGFWRVNVSNNRGSDVMFIHVHSMERLHPTPAIVTENSTIYAEENGKSNKMLEALAGVAAAVFILILLHLGVSFRNRGCSLRYFQQRKAPFDISVHEIYMEIGDNAFLESTNMHADRQSQETDFTRPILCQRAQSVPEVLQSGKLLPIRSISLKERGTHNEYYDNVL